MELIAHTLLDTLAEVSPTNQKQAKTDDLGYKPVKASQWELKILRVLIGSRMYGLQLQDAIRDECHEIISDGTLYTTLHRMHKKGFLEASWGDPAELHHGARRKFYTVSCDGLKVLKNVQVSDAVNIDSYMDKSGAIPM
jgi:DNA-binding PadR family transcriptional regulator